MNLGQRVVCAAVGLHLLLAVGGATGRFPLPTSAAGALVAQYGYVSGADSDFSFFAPAVASQCRATLTLRDAAGREWQDTVFQDPATTFGMRSASILDSFPQANERLQRGIAGSWASVMFGRHPDATEVDVNVEMEALPTMEEWRAGERPTWPSIYKGTFLRKAGLRKASGDGPGEQR